MLLCFSTDGSSMELVERGQFKIYYSGKSHEIAKKILSASKESYSVLKKLYGAGNDLYFIIMPGFTGHW